MELDSSSQSLNLAQTHGKPLIQIWNRSWAQRARERARDGGLCLYVL